MLPRAPDFVIITECASSPIWWAAVSSAFLRASAKTCLILNSKVSLIERPGALFKILVSFSLNALISLSASSFASLSISLIALIAAPFTNTSSKPIVIPFFLIIYKSILVALSRNIRPLALP